MFEEYGYNRKIMEDYVLIDTVLQQLHMSKYKPKPKHIKKYEISPSKSLRPYRNNLLLYYSPSHQKPPSPPSPPSPSPAPAAAQPLNTSLSACNTSQCLKGSGQIKTSVNTNTENDGKASMDTVCIRNTDQIAYDAQTNLHKIKIKYILDDREKLWWEQARSIDNEEFFVKRVIDPKKDWSQKHQSTRTVTLLKTQQAMKGLFYDVKIDSIRKKTRKCLILPQRRVITQEKALFATKQNQKQLTIRQLIQEQLKQQRRRKRTQCKTSASQARHKKQIQKQAKKAQESLRNMDMEERHLLKQVLTDRCVNRRHYFQEMHETVLPWSKEEMKSKTSMIMQKYGVSASKTYYKYLV